MKIFEKLILLLRAGNKYYSRTLFKLLRTTIERN